MSEVAVLRGRLEGAVSMLGKVEDINREGLVEILREVIDGLGEAESLWRMYEDTDEERLALLGAAKTLLDLKDGPRDALYKRRKPGAWEALRAAVAAAEKDG